MKEHWKSQGFVRYEKDREDLRGEALLALARRQAEDMEDDEVAEFAALFSVWTPGTAYRAGECVANDAGVLFRVIQAHTAQADWLPEDAPALYRRLGVTTENPGDIPEWIQPTGSQDCYRTGDRVRYSGKVYVSTMDANVWPPDVAGWREAEG